MKYKFCRVNDEGDCYFTYTCMLNKYLFFKEVTLQILECEYAGNADECHILDLCRTV